MTTDQGALVALRSGEVQAQHSGDYWSKEDREKLYQFFQDGCGISQIAIEMGRTERAIFNQLDRAGLLAPQSRPRSRRANQSGIQCLCPDCNMTTCQNCGKEYTYAGVE